MGVACDGGWDLFGHGGVGVAYVNGQGLPGWVGLGQEVVPMMAGTMVWAKAPAEWRGSSSSRYTA